MAKPDLHQAAREIFDSALRSVDAHESVRRSVILDDTRLTVAGTQLDLTSYSAGVYAIAIGKAAVPMAVALAETLGRFLKGGLIAGPVAGQPLGRVLALPPRKLSTVWPSFAEQRFSSGRARILRTS
ncbi:MAG: DUF4147 domain-containing protein [Pyrinomonadaceae bacterium]